MGRAAAAEDNTEAVPRAREDCINICCVCFISETLLATKE